MKALQFERDIPRYAAARAAGSLVPGRGATHGPLKLTRVDPPDLPTADWVRVRPLLAGICGSDLATIDGRSSRYFEPIVSFPFVPGHEIVGETDDQRRLGAHHHEADVLVLAEPRDRLVVRHVERETFGDLRDAGIAGRAIERAEEGGHAELPGERMFASATADQKHIHRAKTPRLFATPEASIARSLKERS